MGKDNPIKIELNKSTRKRIVFTLLLSFLFTFLFTAELVLPVEDIYASGTGAFAASLGVIGFMLLGMTSVPLWLAGCILTGISGICCAVFRRIFFNGAIIYFNALVKNWNEKTGSIHSFFMTTDTDLQISLCLFIFLCTLLLTAWTVVLLHYQWNLAVLLLSFLFFAYTALVAAALPVWAIVWMGIDLVVLFSCLDLDVKVFLKKKTQIGFLFGGVVVMCGAILAGTYYLPARYLDAAKKTIVSFIEEEAYGKSDLTDGDLANIQDKTDSKEIRLQVKTENDNAFYLRGFVGSKYTGMEWMDLDISAYEGENLPMHQWLSDQGMAPVYSLSAPLLLTESYNPDSYEIESNSYAIENVSASKRYLYLPYAIGNVTFAYDNHIDRDLTVRNPLISPVTTYEVNAVGMPTEDYFDLANNGALTDLEILEANQTYFSAEQTYRDFVRNYYMDVPDDIASMFDQEFSDVSLQGAQSITIAIREYLANRIEYSEEVKPFSDNDEDFVTAMFAKESNGYSVHFATIGTLLFRYFGIPARYVEGYLRKEGVGEVTASDAHAWVEIYRYGFGWVPAEVTPGFYEDTMDTALGQSVQSVLNVDGKQSLLPDFSGLLPDDQSEEKEVAFRLVLLYILLALLLLVLLIVARRILILRLRKKKMHGTVLSQNIRYMLCFIRKNAKKKGIILSEDFSSSFEKRMNEVFYTNRGMDYMDLVSKTNHVYYSQEGAAVSDAVYVEQYLNNMIQVIMRQAGKLRRLKLKYIDVIC